MTSRQLSQSELTLDRIVCDELLVDCQSNRSLAGERATGVDEELTTGTDVAELLDLVGVVGGAGGGMRLPAEMASLNQLAICSTSSFFTRSWQIP